MKLTVISKGKKIHAPLTGSFKKISKMENNKYNFYKTHFFPRVFLIRTNKYVLIEAEDFYPPFEGFSKSLLESNICANKRKLAIVIVQFMIGE